MRASETAVKYPRLRALGVLFVLACGASAITLESTRSAICYFRDRMLERPGDRWADELKTWTCSGDLYEPSGLSCAEDCDPCGDSWFGVWDHMHCRSGGDQGLLVEGKDGRDSQGVLTNIHLVDGNITGSIPPELCVFEALRELDLDGGDLVGDIPSWIPDCFPGLAELDLSYNELSGTIPSWLTSVKSLAEFEVGYNLMEGSVPDDIGSLPKLRELELEGNSFSGRLPDSLSERRDTLTSLKIARNDFEGDLKPLANVELLQVSIHNNPNLCGMVPLTVRYAKGYNPSGTNLGVPCDS